MSKCCSERLGEVAKSGKRARRASPPESVWGMLFIQVHVIDDFVRHISPLACMHSLLSRLRTSLTLLRFWGFVCFLWVRPVQVSCVLRMLISHQLVSLVYSLIFFHDICVHGVHIFLYVETIIHQNSILLSCMQVSSMTGPRSASSSIDMTNLLYRDVAE